MNDVQTTNVDPATAAPILSAAAPNSPAAPTATDNQVTPAAGQSTQSPLDVLEQILNDQKAAAQMPAVPGSEVGAPQAPPPTTQPPQPTAQEVAELEAQRHLEDQAELQEKISELHQITDTPAYQARVQQDATAQAETTATEASQAGFEIVQLDHTKITSE